MQNQNVSFYKPTQFSPDEKGIENYQTIGKETIAYKKISLQKRFDARLDSTIGSDKIWRKENSFIPLRDQLKEGEFAVVERKYSQTGMFDFTTRDNNKINSHADVAFIFRQLENEAVEHAFSVYIDQELNPSVQWLSMGGISATVIDPRIMIDAAQRLEAKQIYFVHNHPSGNLKPSTPDLNIFKKLKRGFEPMGISVNAIIINLNSGEYLLFDESGIAIEMAGFTSEDYEREKKVGVFSFNRQAFLQSPLNTRIESPSDVAQFVSQQKFSSGEKAGYLLLTTKNEIVGNFFATQNTRSKAYKEVAGLVSKFGGANVIAYTNKEDNAQFYRNLKADLINLEINLLDVIECESSAFVCQTFVKYKSMMEQNRFYETTSDYSTNVPKFNKATGEMESKPNENCEEANSNLLQNSVVVISLTQEQKNEMAQNPYYIPPHYGLPDLNPGQVAFVPDVIEGQHLDYQDKLRLYESDLQLEGENTSYHIDGNNMVVKKVDGTNPQVLSFADVQFNSFEHTKNEFENTLRRNQGPLPETFWELSEKENQVNFIIKNSKIMDTQNIPIAIGNEEHLTSKGTDVNSKENYRQMNLDYLANQIKFLGFGEGHAATLSEKMNGLEDAFDLPLTQSYFVIGNPVKKQDVDFNLHFNKGKESDMYFLNSYSAQIKGGQAENNQSQKFYINKGKGITSKEAFNLLSGRAINKDFINKAGESYNAWVKLKPVEANSEKDNRDFQMFSENYGYDLEKTLSGYPIKEMESPESAERLLGSLKKGNMQAVTFLQDGEETSKFISANPQFKNLNVLNQDGSVMFQKKSTSEIQPNTLEQNESPKTTEAPVMKVVKSPGMKR